MIDPDNIQIQTVDTGNIIKMGKSVEPFEFEIYCLDDEKEYKKFIMDCERNIRRSFEYRQFINYIRNTMDMDKCAFLDGVTNENTFDIKIEIHHYPFSLHDIVEIVTRKRSYYNESVSLNMVSKEVMKLHYELLVGLIPLSQTVHELAHSGRIFIPVDKVIGRYRLFVDMYKPFCDPDQLETLDRIEKYSEERRSSLLDTTILNQNRVTYEIQDTRYALPDTSMVNTAMIDQIKRIKDNNYILPTVNDVKMIESREEIKQPHCPVIFDHSLMNTSGKYSWEE